MKFLSWLAGTALALLVATWLIPGIWFTPTDITTETVLKFLATAAILGAINGVVGPALKLLSLPFVIVTLGLFLWIINAWMLMLAGWVSDKLDLGFHVDGFWAALWGALVITLVNWGVNVVRDDR